MIRYAVRIRKTSFVFGGSLYLGKNATAVDNINDAMYWRSETEALFMARFITKGLRKIDSERPAVTVVQIEGSYGNWRVV